MIKLTEELKYFFSGSIFIGLSSAYSLAIPLLVLPYLIKTVGLSSYGLSVIAFSVTFCLSLIIDFGYNISGVNMLSKLPSNKEKSETITRTIYTKISLFLILSLFLAVGIVAIPYLRQHLALYLYSFLITFSSVFNFNWALQGMQKIKTLSMVNVLSKTVYVGGVLLFINNQNDFIYINLFYALGIIISGLLSFFIINYNIPLKPLPYDFNMFVEEIKRSSHYFVSNISIYLSASIYPVILKVFLSNEMIGVFSIVEKIYNLLRAVFSVYINLMLPKISRLVEYSKRIALRELRKTYFFVALFVICQITAAWILRHQIILFFTNEFVSLTVELLEISLIGILIVIFNAPVYLMLLALDKKREIMNTTIVLAITGLILCSVLANFFGVKGAFFSIIFMELLYTLSFLKIYLIKINKT
mgnify:CR=1 FL=1